MKGDIRTGFHTGGGGGGGGHCFPHKELSHHNYLIRYNVGYNTIPKYRTVIVLLLKLTIQYVHNFIKST